MDTKLKNSKTGIAVKAIAFILMITLVFSGSFMLCKSVTLCEPRYGSIVDAYRTNDLLKSFWESDAISDSLRTDAVYLYLYSKYFYDEAAVNDGSAFAKLENEIKAPLEKEIQETIEDSWNEIKKNARNTIFNLAANTDTNSLTNEQKRERALLIKQFPYLNYVTPEIAADGDEEVTEVNAELVSEADKIHSSDDIPDDVVNWYIENHPNLKPSEDEIRKNKENSYNQSIAQAKANFPAVYKTVTERVNKLSALQYVIVMPDGSRLTNSPDGAAISLDDLNSRVISSDFGYSCTEKYGLTQSGYASEYYWMSRPLLHDSDYKGYYYTVQAVEDALDRLKIVINNFGNESTHDYIYGMFRQNSMELYLFSSSNNMRENTDGYHERWVEYAEAHNMIIPALIQLAAAFIILVLLIIFSGTKKTDGGYRKAKCDKIYNDLHFIISGFFAIMAGCIPAILLGEYLTNETATLVFIGSAAGVAVSFAIVAEWLMSVSRQIKAKTLFKHTAVWAFCRFINRKVKSSTSKTKNKLKSRLNTFFKHRVTELRRDIIIFVILYTGANVLLGCLPAVIAAPLLIVFNAVMFVFIWKSIIALDSIMKAVSAAEQGNLNVTLNIGSMPQWIRKFAQDVQDMQNGMRTAVEEAIKGERMKTELITNVSHDLKTPLTSIVTYVDLLKKRPIDDNDALEYISILDEKSARLKHLIEDLVEASKTTTGNVELHPVNVNLYELALQSVGENEDALNAQGLEVRLSAQPENPIVVYADNQKTWRIIENLISNVRKYALSGTRVYIDICEKNGFGVFSVKNITREPIDVPVSELTQRFVRGDSSRSTEGSGLGLSIAANLCELQGGKLDLTVDGDLFKATVYLPSV